MRRPWRTAALRLSDTEPPVEGGHFAKFLHHKDTLDLLYLNVEAFPPPSAATRAAFLEKTAAINVTPATHGDYNIETIKEDSLWLSKQANIDELSALRVVIVEWQNRPAFRLLSGFSDTEKESLRSAAGINDFAGSLGTGPIPDLLLALGSRAPDNDASDTSAYWRRRLLDLYLLERRCLLNSTVQLFIAAQCDSDSWNLNKQGMGKANPIPHHGWTEELGTPMVESRRSSVAKSDYGNIEKLVDELQKRVAGLEKGSGWFKEENAPVPELEEAWAICMLEEMILLMKLLLRQLEDSPLVLPAGPVLLWLRLMDKYSFFSDFTPVCYL